MARRAARRRSSASSSENNGRRASPVESSIDRPATPASIARSTLSATPAGVVAKPLSKSALTGSSVASTMACRWASTCSRVTRVSARACDQAKPALVVARAWKPRLCR